MTSHYNCKAFEDCQRSIYPKSYFPSTGKEYDAESWFYYLRAIYYSPERGTFISPEPTGIDGPNLYWYALNNPSNLVDPTGLWTVFLGGGAAAGAGLGQGEGRDVNFGTLSGGRVLGSNRTGNISVGTFASVGAGNITGGVFGAGFLAGFTIGDIEDFIGKGTSIGFNIFGFSVEVLLNSRNSFSGLQFGFKGRGGGVGLFGAVTNTGLLLDELPGQPGGFCPVKR